MKSVWDYSIWEYMTKLITVISKEKILMMISCGITKYSRCFLSNN